MKYSKGLIAAMAYVGISVVVSSGAAISVANAAQTDKTVIDLLQTTWLFLGSDGSTDHGFRPKTAQRSINAEAKVV